jgi:hypothetical protein
VRWAGEQVRINAQLIDATTGGHLWAERYDGSLADVFALQDNVTRQIVAALAVNLTAGELEAKSAIDTFSKKWRQAKKVDSPYTLVKIDFWDFKDPVARERLREGLRKAGLPEGNTAP